MNDKNTLPEIGIADLQEVVTQEGDPNTDLLQFTTNMLMSVIAMVRKDNVAQGSSVGITACAVAAGIIHGELYGAKVVGSLSEEAVVKVLLHNFKVGQQMGEQRIIERLAEQAAAHQAERDAQGIRPS